MHIAVVTVMSDVYMIKLVSVGRCVCVDDLWSVRARTGDKLGSGGRR